MTIIGWVQFALTLSLVFLAAVPFGGYLANAMQGGRNVLSPVLGPVERGLYALCGVDPARGMGWLGYAAALLMLNALHFLLLYAILRLQYYLPFNPQEFGGMSPKLAFNTVMSFVTNTNWQAYAGETTLSHGAQMFGLTVHNFLSAATGIAAACAVSRAFVAGGLTTLGNFWADLTRATLYILLPLSLVVGVLLLVMGVPQTLAGSVDATTLEGAKQTIALGPVAFQEAIKILGTNGGGFFNANSAHPFENPTALSNLLENFSLLLIPFSLAVAFGHIVGDRRQGFALMWVMGALLATLGGLAYAAEAAGNPLLHALGVDALAGNMEGKEVRFGVAVSSLFAASTTATSTGAVIAMHDSFMPLGGFITLFLMQLGEVVPGGVGSGLYGILVFALLAVFVAGLMVGRTPEYLGKKVQAREVKLAMLAVLILPLSILGGTAISLVTASGNGSLANAGPHGLSEMLYAWTSATANNGSAFAGISADTGLLDYGLALAMLLGRFAFLVPVLAIAGSLAAKPKLPPSAGTFPTHGPLFIGLLVGVILILGGLQFLPALSLGPLAEHFSMLAGKTF
jgi:K+-transporting ATPase ATPase A chain